jgi:RHS repeat-associated protein
MTRDYNKSIYEGISYNHLNMPEHISFRGGYQTMGFTWDASGNKLAVETRAQSALGDSTIYNRTTEYSGNFVYRRDSVGDLSLSYILFDEGRITRDQSGNHQYEYFIKDHLGNVRMVKRVDGGDVETLQQTDYYPFGMVMGGRDAMPEEGENKYLYNGKELQGEFDLDWYDYGARFYDPALGRWHNVDPMADSSYTWSPFNYGKNNPVIRIDPDGREDFLVIQTKSVEKSSAESVWLIYPTNTFKDISFNKLDKYDVGQIKEKFGNPLFERTGSSIPDNPLTKNNPQRNATIREGRYTYSKGEFSSGQKVLYLSEGKGKGIVQTIFKNPKHNGKKIATGVAAHAGRVEWQKQIIMGEKPTKMKGSTACPVVVGFGSIYKNVEEQGNFIIKRYEKLYR